MQAGPKLIRILLGGRRPTMQVQVIDNRIRNLISTIAPVIEASHDMRIAVAFVSQSGLDLIYPSLEIALGVGGSVEFLVGLDMQTTEPAALRSLFGLSSNRANAS